jgi:dTDP-glucose 4,6-dehydratase
VGGREEWAISIEELAEIVLDVTGADPKLLEVTGEEGFTTMTKVVDFGKARRDLKHDPKIDTREGVKRYAAWCKEVYKV